MLSWFVPSCGRQLFPIMLLARIADSRHAAHPHTLFHQRDFLRSHRLPDQVRHPARIVPPKNRRIHLPAQIAVETHIIHKELPRRTQRMPPMNIRMGTGIWVGRVGHGGMVFVRRSRGWFAEITTPKASHHSAQG
jgi:hypothetical protein